MKNETRLFLRQEWLRSPYHRGFGPPENYQDFVIVETTVGGDLILCNVIEYSSPNSLRIEFEPVNINNIKELELNDE